MVIKATLKNKFEPNKNITRAEFTKMLINTLYLYDENMKNNFKDISSNDWYYPYVASSENEKVILGFPDNTFRANNPISIEEAISVASRTLNKKANYRYLEENSLNGTNHTVSEWAKKEYVLAENAVYYGNLKI